LSSLTLRLQKYHAEAGFPFVRLHDVPLAYAAPYAVDISAVFPCPDADENDPRYYTFAKTDAVIGAIVKNGAQVIYRLGQSIEHRDKFHVNPPKDVEKWARVCVNIVRHYNEGWAGGFQYGIQRWEIWNEPDITPCWTGTREQFFDLYVAAAKALKAHDPSLKIGGPGITSPYSGMAEPFLACCRERKAPLDFFSWHCYAVAPDDVARTAVKARDELAAGVRARRKLLHGVAGDARLGVAGVGCDRARRGGHRRDVWRAQRA
jgi:beta-xylosidase